MNTTCTSINDTTSSKFPTEVAHSMFTYDDDEMHIMTWTIRVRKPQNCINILFIKLVNECLNVFNKYKSIF